MELTIKSRKFNKEVTFSRPGSDYIYIDLNGQSGTLGQQICRSGGLMGDTVGYSGDSQKGFESVCRTWWKAYLAEYNEYN